MRSAKEQVDITALIRGILNGYPGNSAIFREYIQNSDDAKATKQIFILDERVHPSQTVCDPTLRDAQGPALLAVNDGLLTDSDWEALRKIHSSSKKGDETQTGKNGLGFRASYHLTENPHVLSGNTLMILDPHHRFAGELAGGLDINVTTEGIDFLDQLEPLKATVADPLQGFEGTAFRLPLRTSTQAKQSKIKDEPTSLSEIRDLLHNFSRELEDAILFLKHLTTIEIRHISPDGRDQMIGKVSITERPTSASQGSFTRTTTSERDGVQANRTWHFQAFALEKQAANSLMSERLGYNVGDALAADKLVPSIELATTLEGEPIRGSLYTLLPLPIRTGFSVHVNAVFALTPDRQSLKNLDEVGTAESRERRLVEWNNTILNMWTPDAWARLLERISDKNPGSAWSVWPSDSKLPYWDRLLHHLIEELVDRKSNVFPIYGGPSTCINLDDPNILLTPQKYPLDLSPLLKLGLKIVQPPPHILAVLETSKIRARILDPRTLHEVLVDGYQKRKWEDVAAEYLRPVIDYLVFSSSQPCLEHIAHLPWFSAADGSPSTIQPAGSHHVFIVPTSKQEASLFIGSKILAWDSMDERLRTALRRSNGSILSARGIQASDVITSLSGRFLAAVRASVDYDWILEFWTWLESSEVPLRKKVLSNSQFKSLHVLPSCSKELRKISEKVAQFDSHDSSSASWRRLGVPILPHELSSTLILLLLSHGFLETPQTAGFVPFIMNHVDDQVSLRPDEVIAIRQSLHASIVRQCPKLSKGNKENLARLRIFATRPHDGGPSSWASVTGPRIQVVVDDGFPLPVQKPSTVYIDVRDRETESFIELLDGRNHKTALEILRIAMDNWKHQPPKSINLFIEQILNRSRHLSQADKRRLHDLPFVTVNGTKILQPPRGLIDPRSELAPLYDGEVGKIPVGTFAKAYLLDLQNLGFLSSTLTCDIVEERLTRLSDSADAKYFQKATAFIKLLDKNWDASFATVVSNFRSRSWLPLSASERTSPFKSRDKYTSKHVSPYLYDLVRRILDTVYITSSSFRSSLGWSDVIPMDLLIEQLRAAVALPASSDQYDRLKTLLVYMGQRHLQNGLSSQQVSGLQDAIEGRRWIPVVGSTFETVSTEYALLQEINLKAPFRQVRQDIPKPLLQVLGCLERPHLESLLGVLGQYNTLNMVDVQTVVAVLEEISEHHPSVSPSTLTIPTQGLQNQPYDIVYYPDIGDYILPSELADRLPVHSSLSRSLCEKLQIPSLTALLLELNEEAFDEDEQMGEDLGKRIHGFLKEYDITYAFNEFLANADDARASQVRATLDCRRFPITHSGSGFISSSFVDVFSRPTLYLFNDGKMNEQDFKGLRKVGQGGKADQMETHGRHGLGALAFYYFTDIVTVISGDHVMILDPSGKYLPSNRGQKRTSLSRRIRDFSRQYPQQLKRYLPNDLQLDGSEPFDGTLFCLPLKRNLSGSSCDFDRVQGLLEKSYRELSQNAFFFTSLVRITAQMHPEFDAEEVQTIWTCSAEREHQHTTSNKLHYHQIKLSLENEHQDWMVLASEGINIPEQHLTTATGLKLTGTGFTAQIAVQTSPTRFKPEFGWLFSTLRLPRRSSLPFHLNARFAISSNRQSIVLDSPDSQQARDAKSAFNSWILADVVPPLYLAALEHFMAIGVPRDLSSRRWWLLEPGVDDGISQVVSESFLQLLNVTDILLFRAVDGSLLSFKDAVFESKKEEDAHIVKLLITLEARRLVLGYSSLSICPKTSLVDPSYVSEIMTMTSLDLVAELCRTRKLVVEDLIDILLYIGQEHITPGLPLLMLSSKVVTTIPDASAPPIYFSHNTAHATLFASTPFLHRKYATTKVLSMWKAGVNVAGLTPEDIPVIVQRELEGRTDAQSRDAFMKQFWDGYPSLPGPPEISAFENPPILLLALSTGDYISLESCKPEHVVYLASIDRARNFGPALEWLGIQVLRHETNSDLKSYLSEKFPVPEANVLQCLAKKAITSFPALPGSLKISLTMWLRKYIQDNVLEWRLRSNSLSVNIDKDHLYRLQIWNAKSTGPDRLRSIEQMRILPLGISAESIYPFLRPNIAIAQESTYLVSLKMFCFSRNTDADLCMSVSEILNSITLPNGVANTSKIQQYRRLFSEILSQFSHPILSSANQKLQLVDASGHFRKLTDLYDHGEPLFMTCLSFTPRTQFMHPLLRDVNPTAIRRLGLIHQVSTATFRTCVRALEEAIDGFRSHNLDEDYQPSKDALWDMCRVAFECFTSRMPRIIMRDQSSWESLDPIQFVRVKDSRRQGASYPADLFCERAINEFTSPSQCVLPEYEPIAWTQRALFFHEPTDDLTALHQTLGVPTAHEVVDHLQILTLRVARSHPGNSTLLSDLTATYKWLNDHTDDAREFLLRMEDQDIFLNVDDPTTTPWASSWISAKKIVLNLSYDWGAFKHVRRFLEAFPNLLRAAGCRGRVETYIAQAPSVSAPAPGTRVSLTNTFNEMRIAGELTDIELVPMFVLKDQARVGLDENAEMEVDSDDSGPSGDYQAHRAYLAATVPHLRSLASFRQDTKFKFYGSKFGAKAVLDFIYTGEFRYESPSFKSTDPVEPVEELLYELLELLSVADEWQYSDLTSQIEQHILRKHNLVNFLFPHYAAMLQKAKEYNAKNLEKALVEWAEQNHELLQDLPS